MPEINSWIKMNGNFIKIYKLLRFFLIELITINAHKLMKNFRKVSRKTNGTVTDRWSSKW